MLPYKNNNSALGDTILKLHVILIPMFNKLFLLQKQVTKILKIYLKVHLSHNRVTYVTFWTYLNQTQLYNYPMFFVEFEETARFQTCEFCFFLYFNLTLYCCQIMYASSTFKHTLLNELAKYDLVLFKMCIVMQQNEILFSRFATFFR